MSDSTLDLNRTLFGKSVLGQQEIQSRALRLDPIMRRLLILIDGKRNFQELSTFVAGHNLADMLRELQARGCIEAAAKSPLPEAPQAVSASQPVEAATSENNELAKLPEASTRTANDVEKARHFMMNTINTVYPQNFQVNLLEAIFACNTAQDVRRVYPKWAETIASSKTGGKRLPEFRDMLLKVL